MKKKQILSILVVITLILSLMMMTACTGNKEPAGNDKSDSGKGTEVETTAKDDKMVIGVTFKSIKQEFDTVMKAGIEETAKELGIEIVTVDANFNMENQRSAVDDFVTQKVDAIIMSPVNSTGSAAMVQSAQDKGIPVITIDIGTDEGVERCYVASDNVKGGKIIAEYMVNDLGITSGEIIVLDLKEDISVRERCQGFIDVISEYPGIELVAHMDGGGNRAESLAIAESVLQGNPDVDIVFGSIGDMVVGVATAAKAAGRDDLTLVGYDADYDVLKLIESGQCKGITAQFPFNIGKEAVETAVKLKNGEDVPNKLPIDVAIVGEHNLSEFLTE